MKVTNILVTHSFYPDKLLKSVQGSGADQDWHVFFHGHNRDLMARIGDTVSDMKGRYYPYCNDRGLSKSWNEAISNASEGHPDVILLLNDDLFFYENCYDLFLQFIAEQQAASPQMALCYVTGLESGQSPYAGIVQQQGFACCAITKRAIETVGAFDENFRPAYYEDVDYYRRAALSGLSVVLDERVLVEHERSLTMRLDPDLAARDAEIKAINRDYFSIKWGGDAGSETFRVPFGQEKFGLMIPFEQRASPYGLEFDRPY